MRKIVLVLVVLVLLVSLVCLPLSESSISLKPGNGEIGDTPVPPVEIKINTNASMYCWDRYLLNERSYYSEIREYFSSLNITRVYQGISSRYLEKKETAEMVDRLVADGIELVLLQGDSSWGLAENDLSGIKKYIDKVVEYNASIGSKNPIKKIALDIETHTHSEWNEEPKKYFAEYIENMREIYEYAHSNGFEVVQVIPARYDKIDEELFRRFVETCADEISIMNYRKDTQVTAIEKEVAVCRELGKPIETIFETMPDSKSHDVTASITYFYDGLEALNEKRDEILKKYNYEGLSVSYHHFPTMYHVATGKYMAEIYVYTNKEDPTRNELGQTDAIPSLILTGDDGSVIEAGLYNPNLGREYEESCYFVMGVLPDVKYTISCTSEEYEIDNQEILFSFEDDELVDYRSLKVHRIS